MPVNGHPFHLPAESEGFEPPVQRNVYTAFRVRLFRPLRQLSSKSAAKVRKNLDICKFISIYSTECGILVD